jgi:5-methylcytosine-specific restriction endonuclease McrA
MLVSGAAQSINFDGGNLVPMLWDEWSSLPVGESDEAIRTRTHTFRVPTVIIASGFSRVPFRRPKRNLKGVAARDGGRCIFTGKVIPREEQTIEHLQPKSRGGSDDWNNIALASKSINNKKSNQTVAEFGMPLHFRPFEPRPLPASVFIQSEHPHHKIFLNK